MIPELILVWYHAMYRCWYLPSENSRIKNWRFPSGMKKGIQTLYRSIGVLRIPLERLCWSSGSSQIIPHVIPCEEIAAADRDMNTMPVLFSELWVECVSWSRSVWFAFIFHLIKWIWDVLLVYLRCFIYLTCVPHLYSSVKISLFLLIPFSTSINLQFSL